MKPKFAIFALACLGGPLTAAVLTDDFSGGLGNWTSTVILDNAGAGNNTATWQVNGSGQLELETTVQNGIDQYAYIYTGAFLAVGEEAQVDMTIPTSGNRNIGLYVGGTAPVGAVFPGANDTRSDNITNYGAINGAVATRGQDGTSEYGNTQIFPADVKTLFIERRATNTFDIGYYNTSSERFVYETRNPLTANSADFVGIYADARAVGTVGAIDTFRIVPEPSSALLGALGFLALLRRRRA